MVLGVRRRVREARWRLLEGLKDGLVGCGVLPDLEAAGPTLTPLPPLEAEPFVGALRGKVRETLEAAADAINAAPNAEVVAASAGRVLAAFTALQREAVTTGLQMRLDAAVAPPGAAAMAEPLRISRAGLVALRHRVEEMLERLGDALHDAILDAGWRDRPDGSGLPQEPLPSMSREAYCAALRGKVEAALRRVAEILNAAPGGALEAADEQRLGELFVGLQREALELGLEMRLEEWEANLPPALGAPPAAGVPLRLRKAADPGLPASQEHRLRWAEKLRRMRAAGTAWPLSHQAGEGGAW
jgi:hypothetical protein